VRHELLSDERRRTALAVVEALESPVDLAELAGSVAAATPDLDPEVGATLERVAVSLHHVHLPKLAAHDVLDYDEDTKIVRP
jgi:hypothetical protein